jgi:DNA-directed RNA polymerase specialized sigma24 family protein
VLVLSGYRIRLRKVLTCCLIFGVACSENPDCFFRFFLVFLFSGFSARVFLPVLMMVEVNSKQDAEGEASESCHALVLRHQDSLYTFLNYLLEQKTRAVESAISECFISAFKNSQAHQSEDHFKSALYARAVEIAKLQEQQNFICESTQSRSLADRIEIEQVESTKVLYENILRHSIERLPFEYRLTFLLGDIGGFAIETIAEITKEIVANVRENHTRARIMLRRMFLKELSQCSRMGQLTVIPLEQDQDQVSNSSKH